MNTVAILTPHYAYNYGAKLQAFALAEAIRKLGNNIIFINRRPKESYCVSDKPLHWIHEKERQTRLKGFIEFEKKFLQPQTLPIYDNADYTNLDFSKYKAIVVGSDQIWRDSFFYSSFGYSQYLYFIKDDFVRKVSYAASFGKDTCIQPEERRKTISLLLKRFDNISVREESGVTILRNTYGVNGDWVADPTLLHTADFYCDFFSLSRNDKLSKTLSTYILANNLTCMKKCKFIAKSLDCDIYNIYKPTLYDKIKNHKFLYKLPDFRKIPSIIEWLNIILSSRYILTDSFHGMVFCIIFRKQFVVLNRKSGGTERYKSLLNLLGLSERLCEWNTTIEQINTLLKKEIDYEKVYDKLNVFREKSFVFLVNAIR